MHLRHQTQPCNFVQQPCSVRSTLDALLVSRCLRHEEGSDLAKATLLTIGALTIRIGFGSLLYS